MLSVLKPLARMVAMNTISQLPCSTLGQALTASPSTLTNTSCKRAVKNFGTPKGAIRRTFSSKTVSQTLTTSMFLTLRSVFTTSRRAISRNWTSRDSCPSRVIMSKYLWSLPPRLVERLSADLPKIIALRVPVQCQIGQGPSSNQNKVTRHDQLSSPLKNSIPLVSGSSPPAMGLVSVRSASRVAHVNALSAQAPGSHYWWQ
jgi:hypothetical protein